MDYAAEARAITREHADLDAARGRRPQRAERPARSTDPYADLPHAWQCDACGEIHEGTQAQHRARVCLKYASADELTAVEQAGGPTMAATFTSLDGGGYVYRLPELGVAVELRHLRRERGHVHGEIDVQCNWAGARTHEGSLSCADQNLSSQAARRALAKYCAERARTHDDDFDWQHVIDAACLRTLRAEREGDEPIVLDDAPDDEDQDVDVLGLMLPVDAPSLIIAPGDSMKSLILLVILGTLAQRGIPTLYLDNEWTAARHKGRKLRLFGTERIPDLHYLRCRGPVTLEADRVRRFCDAHGVLFLGVDSVGLACDGPLKDDDTAIRFYRAVNSIRPALCAAHVPKSSIGPDSKEAVGAFGSVYFTNLARMTWLVKKQPGVDENVVSVGLFPQKQNHGERQRPVGLEFTFTGPQITYRPVDLAGVEGLSAKLPLAARIHHELRHGPQTYASLADALDAKVDSIIKAAKRSTNFTIVTGKDGIQRVALIERRRS